MQRIMVIGCPGSGKSTFAKELAKITSIELIHLDMLYWNKDKTTVDDKTFNERLHLAVNKPCWIIDGNFSSTIEIRLNLCDTVIFLDYPTEVCVNGVLSRLGKVRGDIPWVEGPEPDEQFMNYVKGFNLNKRPQIVELLKKYSHKKVIVFTGREQASAWLLSLR